MLDDTPTTFFRGKPIANKRRISLCGQYGRGCG